MDQALSEKVDRLLGKVDAVLGVLGGQVDPDRSMTTDEAAAFLRVHKTSLLRYVTAGTLRAHRIGKSFTFTRADLINFRAECRLTTSEESFLGKLITQGK